MYLNHNAWFNDYSDNSYYGKAIDEVNEVINSGKFSLAPNYSDNFREDISGSPEIIFGIPFEFNYAGGNYMANMWMHVAGRATWQFNGWLPVGRLFFLNFWKHTMKKTAAMKTVGYQDSNMTMPVLPFMWTVNLWYILGNYIV